MKTSFIYRGRGQTLIEFAFFILFISAFITLAYYFGALFEVSQKQTMLVRTQAFVELGNYSSYAKTQHGADNPRANESRVTFKLGEKSKDVRVDLEKNRNFKKAVEGDLKLDVTVQTNNRGTDDIYWTTYNFPRAKTEIEWMQGGGADGIMKLELGQTLTIVHNRSIDFKKENFLGDKKKTGMFSGGITMKDLQTLVGIQLTPAKGIQDDVEQLRMAVRMLARNDPSLSDEAAALEKDLNAADSLSGSTQAALISLAISVAMQIGVQGVLQGLSELAPPATPAGSDTALAGASATAKSDFISSYFKNAFGNMTDVTSATASAGAGTFLDSAYQALTSPIMAPINGATQISNGLQAGTTQGLFSAMAGASPILNTAQTVGAFAGQNMQELGLASSLLSIPQGVSQGLSTISTGMADQTTRGVGNFVKGFNQIMQPVTGAVMQLAPELAVPLSLVNAGVGLVGAANGAMGALDAATAVGATAKDAAQALQAVGALTTSVGALYGSLDNMTGGDGKVGGYLMLAGGTMQITGAGAQAMIQMKEQGINIANPVEVGKYIVDKNVQTLKNSIDRTGQQLTAFGDSVNQGLHEIFTPSPQLQTAEAKGMIGEVAKLDKATSTGVDYALTGVDKVDLTKANLLNAESRLKSMNDSVLLNMQYQGASADQIAAMQADFATTLDGIHAASEFKNSKDGVLTENMQNRIAAANVAAQKLNETYQNYLNERSDFNQKVGLAGLDANTEKGIIQDQVKAIRGGGDQKRVENRAIAQGLEFNEVRKMEVDINKEYPILGTFGELGGAERTGNRLSDQQAQADALARVQTQIDLQNAKAAVDGAIKQAEWQKTYAMNLTRLAESSTLAGPIVTADNYESRRGAGVAADFIRSAMEARPNDFSETEKTRMSVAIDKFENIQTITPRAWISEQRERVAQLREKQETIIEQAKSIRIAATQ